MSDRTPRQPPTTVTATANNASSSTSAGIRYRSAMEMNVELGSSEALTMTSSPTWYRGSSGLRVRFSAYTLHLVALASLPFRLTPSGHDASERLTRPYSGELPASAALSQRTHIARLPSHSAMFRLPDLRDPPVAPPQKPQSLGSRAVYTTQRTWVTRHELWYRYVPESGNWHDGTCTRKIEAFSSRYMHAVVRRGGVDSIGPDHSWLVPLNKPRHNRLCWLSRLNTRLPGVTRDQARDGQSVPVSAGAPPRATSCSQAITRTTFMAVAVQTCWRCVRANPM